MKKYLTKKRIVFVSVIVLLIVIAGLYNTYAMGVYVDTTTPIEHDMALSFELSSSINEVTSVEAGKSKILEVKVTNNNRDAVQYAVTYQMVNPTTIPENFTIGQYMHSTHSPSGLVEAEDSAIVSIKMTNNTDSTVNVKFNVVNGYKNGGDLIIPDGEEIVPVINYATTTLTNLGLSVNSGTPDFTKTSYQDYDTVREIMEYWCIEDWGYTTLEECMINEYELSSFDDYYNEYYVPYMPLQDDTGIYATEDDFGTSYYFRGNVTNNYVKFGKNSSGSDMYWRIIRINSDGTVRIIYDGTSAHANGEVSTDRQVGTSAFNSSSNDNTYVGYMYGTAGATTYAETHSNTNNSTIKTYLEGNGTTSNEGWYKDNIIDTGYEDYIADAIYCNDRSLSSANSSYTGIGTTTTYYGAYQRYDNDLTPSLKCHNDNDKFTVSSLGNGKNKYPIGLITADELYFAGAQTDFIAYSSFYLNIGTYFWTMSPSSFYGSSTYDVSVGGDGDLYFSYVFRALGVRPVVSLKSNVLQYGTGTMSNPFSVEDFSS